MGNPYSKEYMQRSEPNNMLRVNAGVVTWAQLVEGRLENLWHGGAMTG